ncbi:Yos1-like protein [Rhizoclosmatium globosum]|uniref:Yos1-like protein n=1 Tax=Rhizoclosmatium globosum TaxID=329046 RepID=A0A1Y2C4P7_9FUNG|nr:hypothetical protein HDU79_004896 [Rhizoclosmatium sp. JEL0117]ORY41867.1 Yos1-like protein [Rhizoclosmatium globosum]|eukprot:ORY41867.1 Yos1-like protein [Rhizoclosmatium globosum]
MFFATSFGTLFYVSVLLVNAIAILNEQRFLARIGLSEQAYQQSNFGNEQTVTLKVINLISAVRTLLRIPLIVVNILIIVYELILG